jgi:hypothetical protein
MRCQLLSLTLCLKLLAAGCSPRERELAASAGSPVAASLPTTLKADALAAVELRLARDGLDAVSACRPMLELRLEDEHGSTLAEQVEPVGARIPGTALRRFLVVPPVAEPMGFRLLAGLGCAGDAGSARSLEPVAAGRLEPASGAPPEQRLRPTAGWFGPEAGTPGSPAGRWIGRSAQALLDTGAEEGVLYVKGWVPVGSVPGPARLHLWLDGRPLGEAAADAEGRLETLLRVPAGEPGRPSTLDLFVEPTFVPRQLGLGPDRRVLGLKILQIYAGPALRQPDLPVLGIPRARRHGAAPRAEVRFVPVPFELAPNGLFDVGVVDADDDGILDVFTSNHSAPQSLLLGDGRGGFRDVLTEWGLDQNPDFPGFAEPLEEPQLDRPGLYIYRGGKLLTLHAHRLSELGPVSGEVITPLPLTIHSNEGFDALLAPAAADAQESRVRFVAARDGRLVLNARLISRPMAIRLQENFPLDHVYVGVRRVVPRTRELVLRLRDRHGIAWADFGGDGRTDVFISRGGLKGSLQDQPDVVSDELLVRTGAGFEDRTAASGLRKAGCRARRTAFVDADVDGLLDLWIGCLGTPDQLFRRLPDGRFQDVAAGLGLDRKFSGAARWLDVDLDGRPDLLIEEGGRLALYRNRGGRFEREGLGRVRDVRQLAVADYDGDGDPDVLVASEGRSLLLVNLGVAFRPIGLELLGLPATAQTASWVDFDNDGLVDLHVVPGGLFRQRPDGSFERELQFPEPPGPPAQEAWSLWLDVDEDGDRDLLLVLKDSARAARAWLYRNEAAVASWLQIDLVGPPGNRQAIGARVRVEGKAGAQTQEAGWAEGSRFSQGHYRLYFGLGNDPGPVGVHVRWPDGREQRLDGVGLSRKLELRHPSAPPPGQPLSQGQGIR